MELRIFTGWTRESNMPATYLHLSGADIEKKILQKNGIIEDDTKENVSTTAQDNTKAKDSFGQMHTLCGKYMTPGSLNSNELESMHKSCGEYMNSDSFKGSGMMSTASGNNNGGFSFH